MLPTIVIDIANVASYNKRKSKPKLKFIELVYDSLPNNIDMISIADSSLYYCIDKKKRYKEFYLSSKKIIEAPIGIPADIFILKYGIQKNGIIISNDLFF